MKKIQMSIVVLIVITLLASVPNANAVGYLNGSSWTGINSIYDASGYAFLKNATPICSGADYCIYNISGTTTVINSTTQSIDYSGTNAATIHNQAYATAGMLPKKIFKSIGTFGLSSNLDPQSNSIIDLSNAYFTLSDGANTDIIRNTTTNDGIEIIGGYLDVNGANQVSSGRGIQLQNTSNLTITDTMVVNARLQSFYIAQLGTINDVLLDKVKAYNGAVDIASNNEIFVSGSNIKVKDCISKGSYDGGVVASSYSVFPGSLNDGITIEGCNIQNAGTGIYIGNNGHKVFILHNNINGTVDTAAADGAGIQIQNSSLGTQAASKIIVDGNIVDNVVYRGLHIYNNAAELKITNNFITVSDTGAQDINVFVQNVTSIDMYGNTFNKSGGHVISLSSVQRGKIYSNTILTPNLAGGGGSGIRGVDVSNVTIYNNDIRDEVTPIAMQYPIYFTGTGQNNIHFGNTIMTGTSGGITGVSGLVIAGTNVAATYGVNGSITLSSTDSTHNTTYANASGQVTFTNGTNNLAVGENTTAFMNTAGVFTQLRGRSNSGACTCNITMTNADTNAYIGSMWLDAEVSNSTNISSSFNWGIDVKMEITENTDCKQVRLTPIWIKTG